MPVNLCGLGVVGIRFDQFALCLHSRRLLVACGSSVLAFQVVLSPMVSLSIEHGQWSYRDVNAALLWCASGAQRASMPTLFRGFCLFNQNA